MDEKEDTVLKLSDAFVSEKDAERGRAQLEYDIEVKVRMININHGHNQPLMDQCSPLAEYAWLVDRIRKNSVQMEIESAVDKAIDDMPDSYQIRKYLVANRSEVKNMCITEYNEAETMRMLREEAEEKAEEKFGRLIAFLMADGMTEEVKKAASDKAARAEMYRKYGIV